MTGIPGITPPRSCTRHSASAHLAAHTMRAHARHHLAAKYCAGFLLALMLLTVSGYARANCTTWNYHVGTVSFPSATITLPNYPHPGLILWTSPPTPVTNPLSGTCNGHTSNGLDTRLAGAAATSDHTLFPTGIAGLSYRILFTGSNAFTNAPSGIQSYPNQPSASGNITFEGDAQLQLVITDSTAFASANPTSISGLVAQWNVVGCTWFIFCEIAPVINFNTSAITFTPPACSVIGGGNMTVPLPAVFQSDFSGIGSTSGRTPFNLELTCSAVARLFITLSAGIPASGLVSSGVMGSNGSAEGVGVQLLKADGVTPIPFGTPVPQGNTSATRNLGFYTQYYQTKPSVTAGSVHATATYTLTYQ